MLNLAASKGGSVQKMCDVAAGGASEFWIVTARTLVTRGSTLGLRATTPKVNFAHRSSFAVTSVRICTETS
jgi:hypothetical protein